LDLNTSADFSPLQEKGFSFYLILPVPLAPTPRHSDRVPLLLCIGKIFLYTRLYTCASLSLIKLKQNPPQTLTNILLFCTMM
jgi:hypothetical protein